MTGNEAAQGFSLSAPAKLNLYLHVLGRRSDGYHLLDSLIVFAGLFDELAFQPASRLDLAVRGPFANALADTPPQDNLVLRAGRNLAQFAKAQGASPPGAAITLTKNLPVAAGIGGGSADAAAALLGLARLWGLACKSGDLAQLGLDLGADVPVCLEGKPAFVRGIGEKVTPAGGMGCAGLLLVNPGLPLSTAAVFGAHGARAVASPEVVPPEAVPPEVVPRDAQALARFLTARRNDLTETAIGLLPAIGDVLGEIANSKHCLLARMSGSGPTCFGLYRDLATAQAAANVIGGGHPAWWVAAGTLLSDGAG